MGKKDLDNALAIAARLNEMDAVERLLDRGANPFAKDASGKTAIQRAAQNGHHSIAQKLLKHPRCDRGR